MKNKIGNLSLKCSQSLVDDIHYYGINVSKVCRKALVEEVNKQKAIAAYLEAQPVNNENVRYDDKLEAFVPMLEQNEVLR